MKGYYIHFNATSEPGVKRKIEFQIRELSKISLVREINISPRYKSFIIKLLRRIPFIYPCLYKYNNALNEIVAPDYVYIRRTYADKYYYNFIKYLKKNYPMCRIIIEIPTYPYIKDDFIHIKNWTLGLKELFYINFFNRYVDRFVTYSEHNIIYKVPSISIMNGVDTTLFTKKKVSQENDVLAMIAVATFRRHHGYERIIKGLYDYKNSSGTRKIKLYLVGNGPELSYYKDLTKEYSLDDYIVFCGAKTGKELDILYDKADIGLGSFGFYKIGLTNASSLKTREYLCKGLPVVSGCLQDIFIKYPCDYHYEFSNDDSVVDIKAVIAFYDNLYNGELDYGGAKLKLIEDIRLYANKYVSMESTFSPVLSYIKESVKE